MKKMKGGRATGIGEMLMEMLVMAEHVGVLTRRLLNTFMKRGEYPRGVAEELIVPCMEKGREIFHDPGTCRGHHVVEPCP